MAGENRNQTNTHFSLKMRELHEIELEAARKTLAPRELPEEVEIACAAEIDKKRRLQYDEDIIALKAKNSNASVRPYVTFTRENVFSSKNVFRGGKNLWAIVSDDGQKYYFEYSEEVNKFREVPSRSEEQERLKTMPSIFISYSRADVSVVQQLEQALLTNGHVVWRDQESLYGGQQWPKAIGEAIASRDFFVLVWSQHAASSHFVEFEWNTALALKKVILPCLFDDTPLPPALSAINGIFCKDFETGLSRVLQALQQPPPASDSSHANAVINKLQALPAAAPEQMVQAAKTLFAQQNWNVQGNIFQAARDIYVNLNTPIEKPEKRQLKHWQLWVGIIVFAIIAGLLEFSDKFTKLVVAPKQEATRPAEIVTSYLRGYVKDTKGQSIAGATIRIEELPIDTTLTQTTTSDGGFRFDSVPAGSSVLVRVFAEKNGYIQQDKYVNLPGPVQFKLEQDKK